MKKLIRSIAVVLLMSVMVLSFASCSIVSPFIGESGYFGIYSSVDLSSADSVIASINTNIPSNEAYSGYKVTYVYEHANKAEEYNYTTKYNLTAKINSAALVNEVFALFDLKIDYKQADGQYGVDADVNICIVRTGSGTMYSDYTVYAQVNGANYKATFDEMKDKLDQADNWRSDIENNEMKYALDTRDTNSSAYLEVVLEWIQVEYGDYLLSSGENPLIQATHDYNKGMFISLVQDAKVGSDKQYKVSTSGDDKFRASKSYSMKEQNFQEESDIVAFLKLNGDGTYTCKYTYDWMRKHPYEDRASTYERVLEPLSEAISRPSFAN